MKCAGEKFWLRRAVDQHGTVLEEILQKRRDKRAAKRPLVALLKRYGFVPKRIITDKLRSYGAAKAHGAPGLDHWSHKGLNNRAENSHLPFRKRERTMQGQRSPGALQRFVAIHSRYPQLLFSSIPPPRRTNDSLPSPRSVRRMENRGLHRLKSQEHRGSSRLGKVNVTTPDPAKSIQIRPPKPTATALRWGFQRGPKRRDSSEIAADLAPHLPDVPQSDLP